MVLDAVSNFVRGNTDASVDSTQTTVSVDDASIFPDPASDGEYNVVIWDVASHPRPDQDPAVEILRVTAIDTTNDDLTVTRGQETTSGASHPSGSAIHLSPTAKMFGDIESTFAEFYDDANQELTADVNNGSVSTDQLNTAPTGILAQLSANQTVANNSRTKVEFDSETSRGEVSGLVNASSEIIIPSGFNWAMISTGLAWDDLTDIDNFRVRKNGGTFDGAGELWIPSGSITRRHIEPLQTAFFSVTQGDSLTVEVKHVTGTTRDIVPGGPTFAEVVLL